MPIVNWDPTRVVAFAQPQSFAHSWKPLPKETTITGPSGGGSPTETDFLGDGTYRGKRFTGNPEPVTFTISTRYQEAQVLRDLQQQQCPYNIMTLYGCSPQDISNFVAGELYIDVTTASFGASENVMNGMERTNPKVNDTLDADAAVRELFYPLTHGRVVTTFASGYTDILALGAPNCPGICGPGNSLEKEFLLAGGAVSPSTVPNLVYTPDGFVTQTTKLLTGITNGAAVSLAVCNGLLLIAVTGTSAGVYSVPLREVRAGTITVVASSGLGGADVNRVFAVDGIVLACGDAGDLWVSAETDGYSFTPVLQSSTEDLLTIGGISKDLLWVGGTNGALLRVRGTYQTEVLTAPTSDDITVVRVPPFRPNELFIGTDAGAVWRTENANDPVPVWTQVRLPAPTTSRIEDIQFAGTLGCTMWVVQTNGSSQSRVLVDYSGGNGNAYAIAWGTFTAPANSGLVRVAPTGMNHAITAGAVNTGAGFVGRLMRGQ